MADEEQRQLDMFEASFGRPRNFFQLNPRTQWEIDSSLGILDWEGLKNPTEEQKRRIKEHYS